jgi:CRISPR-associated protein Cmr3
VRPHAKTPQYNEEETKNPREAYLHEAHDPDAISGLWVTISADDNRMSEQGIIATGGESRFAYYEKIDTADNITARQEHRGRVKLILQTPAYFSDGCQPKGGWGQLMGEAKLISFAINGYESISGWNIVMRKPRPMRRLVPAGSVFYFEDVTNLPDALTENDGDDYPFAQMGFGSYIATPFDYQD